MKKTLLSSKEISTPAAGVGPMLGDFFRIVTKHAGDSATKQGMFSYDSVTEVPIEFPLGYAVARTFFCGVADSKTAHRDVLWWSTPVVYGEWPVRCWIVKARYLTGARIWFASVFGNITGFHAYIGSVVDTPCFVKEAQFYRLVCPITLLEITGEQSDRLVRQVDGLLSRRGLNRTAAAEHPDFLSQF